MNTTHQIHPIKPLYGPQSEILILGSFPSVKSREVAFFYGHPHNRFWRVLAGVYDTSVPVTVEEKREFVLSHRLALWDVIASCDIAGSSDSSIKNVVPNDLTLILKNSHIKKIFVNGKTAFNLYNKYILPVINIKAIYLPSTSPANAAFSLERLIEVWRSEILRADDKGLSAD
ncbi:MAG: DNA-deoxyinosine glycosylase [Acutalibacteraceae bacterium]